MRTLADWKGLVASLRLSVGRAKDRAVRREYVRALRYARRRVALIERHRLRPAQWLLLIALVYIAAFMAGCATMSGFGEDVKAVSDGYRSQQSK